MVVADAELLIGSLISKRRDCIYIRHDDIGGKILSHRARFEGRFAFIIIYIKLKIEL